MVDATPRRTAQAFWARLAAMSATAFTKNYTDHSNDTGFQFEFHCDKCGNGFRSAFKGSALGIGAKIAKGLGSFFGGGSKLWSAGVGAEYMKDGLRGGAWDAAFKTAIDEIKPKFHQCTRCGNWVCPDVCWNEARQLCEACAPDLAEEAASHQAQIASDQMRENMMKVDQTGGADASAQMLSACPHCKARLQPGTKFCASCGKPVIAGAGAPKKFCVGCGGTLAPNAKFCGGCGQAAG